MINIDRPDDAPDVLVGAGSTQTVKDRALYDTRSMEFRNGRKRFKFKQTIYADPCVKRRLYDAQHRKCCYCERFISSPSKGEVEHYRPKSSVKQALLEPKIRPGYYWLAYEWENLLLVCGACNRKKSDLFPLKDPCARARSHHDKVEIEDPMLVDPSLGDPRVHIRFRLDAPVGYTPRGRETIKLIGLDESGLSEERRQRLEELRRYVDFLRVLRDGSMNEEESGLAAEIRTALEDSPRPSSRYSSMAIDFLKSVGYL